MALKVTNKNRKKETQPYHVEMFDVIEKNNRINRNIFIGAIAFIILMMLFV